MTKLTNIKGMLPTSIENLMPANAPNFNLRFRDILISLSKVPTCQIWLENYNSIVYRKSIFFKGPLLYKDFFEAYQKQGLGIILFNRENLFSCKKAITKFLVRCQSDGDPNEWQVTNNFLEAVNGPRRSARNVI